ncbi:unnamed protein product, partial [Rotaria sp. Silwood1]
LGDILMKYVYIDFENPKDYSSNALLLSLCILLKFLAVTGFVLLSINENAMPDVHVDMEIIFNILVPEDNSYERSNEGKDDISTDAKCSLFGSLITRPITSRCLIIGTWEIKRNFMTEVENKINHLVDDLSTEGNGTNEETCDSQLEGPDTLLCYRATR